MSFPLFESDVMEVCSPRSPAPAPPLSAGWAGAGGGRKERPVRFPRQLQDKYDPEHRGPRRKLTAKREFWATFVLKIHLILSENLLKFEKKDKSQGSSDVVTEYHPNSA